MAKKLWRQRTRDFWWIFEVYMGSRWGCCRLVGRGILVVNDSTTRVNFIQYQSKDLVYHYLLTHLLPLRRRFGVLL